MYTETGRCRVPRPAEAGAYKARVVPVRHKEVMVNSKWKMIGSAVLAAMAFGAAMNFTAIKRYIRMSTM